MRSEIVKELKISWNSKKTNRLSNWVNWMINYFALSFNRVSEKWSYRSQNPLARDRLRIQIFWQEAKRSAQLIADFDMSLEKTNDSLLIACDEFALNCPRILMIFAISSRRSNAEGKYINTLPSIQLKARSEAKHYITSEKNHFLCWIRILITSQPHIRERYTSITLKCIQITIHHNHHCD